MEADYIRINYINKYPLWNTLTHNDQMVCSQLGQYCSQGKARPIMWSMGISPATKLLVLIWADIEQASTFPLLDQICFPEKGLTSGGGGSHIDNGIRICACLLWCFFTNFGIAIGVFHHRQRHPIYKKLRVYILSKLV